MKKGFSLIEVIFAISFLIMVGIALSALNAASVRFVNIVELKTTGNALNEQALGFMALEATKSDFKNKYIDGGKNCDGSSCYLICPEVLNQRCDVENTKNSIRLGESRVPFTTMISIKELTAQGGVTVTATTDWGNGWRNQVVASQFIAL